MAPPEPPLSPEELQEIREEIALVPSRRSACIDALKVVQRHRGWVSDGSILALAGLLKMSPEDLDSVATFYNLLPSSAVPSAATSSCSATA